MVFPKSLRQSDATHHNHPSAFQPDQGETKSKLEFKRMGANDLDQ